MPALFPPVAPGDVISSQLMNDLLLKIEELEDRIATLEGGSSGGALIITTFQPAFELAAGGILSINGANFAFPSNLNTVTIDGVPVPPGGFLGGGSSLLIRVVVPSTISAPPGGRNVVVRVSNSTAGFAERLYRILPGVPPVGDPPAITNVAPNPAVIGEELQITGQNFSTTAAENHISFVLTTSGGPVTHEVDPGDILEATATLVRLTVPDMPEVPAPAPFPQPVPATLEIVVGSHPPASQPGGFSVQRL